MKDFYKLLTDLGLDEYGRTQKLHQLYQQALSGIEQEKVHVKRDEPLAVREIYPALALACLQQIKKEHDSYRALHPDVSTDTNTITIELYEDTATSESE